ncbi:DUF5908 family protein [uncultured Litoreibacter sp.]|uniref:DUF5908 family protein n=1 Tax=uncultured Litoreibacter sp. TaxID=1392394 RepID=UPI00261DA887|nr:DUF5908 family protein [uncultured Litoreibacter sp.]
MPVEIRELVLRARVTEDPTPTRDDHSLDDEERKADLLAAVDRRIDAALRRLTDR